MSAPQPDPGTEPKISEDPVADSGSTRVSRLNQPWRGGVAVAEIAVAVLLAFAARWAWHHGVVTIPLPERAGATDVVTRLIGSWLSIAICSGTLAVLLVLDAIRQVLLATKDRKPRHQPV